MTRPILVMLRTVAPETAAHRPPHRSPSPQTSTPCLTSLPKEASVSSITLSRKGHPCSFLVTCMHPAQQLLFSPFSFSSVSLSDSLFSSVTRPKKKKKSCKCEFECRKLFPCGNTNQRFLVQRGCFLFVYLKKNGQTMSFVQLNVFPN